MPGLRNKIALLGALTVLVGGAALSLLVAAPWDNPNGLVSARTSWAVFITLIAAGPVIGVTLLIVAIPIFARDCRRLRSAIGALARNDEIARPQVVHPEIAYCLAELRDLSQSLRNERRTLQENAFRDALTGLPNRRPFMESLIREASFTARSGRPLSLIMADLDHFKRLNDTYGHQAGDRVLKHVAGRFSNLIRQSDMVARFGGEEFAILLPGASMQTAVEIAQLIRNALRSDPLLLDGRALPVSASFGVAEMLECQLSEPDHLLHRADMALYEAKHQGRDRVIAAASVRDLPAKSDSADPHSEEPAEAVEPEAAAALDALDRDTLALMGCTYSVLQVMPDKHRVVRDMMQQVATILQSGRVLVLLANRESGCMDPAARLGDWDTDELSSRLAADSWSGVKTARAGGRCPGPFVRQLEGSEQALLYVPISEYDEVVGVIVCGDVAPDLRLSARQESILRAISAIGASALKSCDVYTRLEQHWMGSIEGLCSAVTPKYGGQDDHYVRVSRLCDEMARSLGLDRADERQCLRVAAHLYDIGKVHVSRSLLEKRGRLRATELARIRDHCRVGAAIVQSLPGLEDFARIVLHHHEHFDGEGYPAGIAGEDIPLESRMIAVADAYEAMISDRPYRRALSPLKAIEQIQQSSGSQFDPQVVVAFLKCPSIRNVIDRALPTLRDAVEPARTASAA